MNFLFLISFVLFVHLKAQAFLVDLNLNNSTDALKTTSDSNISKQFYSLGLFGDIGKTNYGSFYFGWYAISFAQKNEMGTSESETYSTLDMGPVFRWSMDRRRIFSLSLMYAVSCKGKYKSASLDETISGSSYFIKISMEPDVTDSLSLGVSFNYYTSSYNLSVSNSTESTISYTNNSMFPSLSLNYRF